MTSVETAWWAGLSGDDIRLNTQGDPPYDADRVARLVRDRLGDCRRVLDVGCGTGRLAAKYSNLTGAGVVGFDPSPNILGVARERVSLPSVSFTDSLPEGPFGGAYSVTVFQHLPADVCARYVAEVMARMTEGGRFVFQYVEGTEDTFLSHQDDAGTVREWCRGFTLRRFEQDHEFPEWRWVTVQR